ETRQEEEGSFDPIPKTPEGSEEESNDGRGLQVTQNVEDSHVTLTPVNPDGPQESSSVSSFVTSMLNPTSDVGVESIFTTASSPIVSLQTPTSIMTPSTIATITTSSDAPILPPTIPMRKKGYKKRKRQMNSTMTSILTREGDYEYLKILKTLTCGVHFTTASSPIAPLPTPTPIMTPSTIATITTSSDAPIPPTTTPSAVLQNLPTFDSVFRFEKRVKSLEVNFSKFMQTNQFAEAVSNIPADLTEMELKKILIEKMEGNKSIQRSDEQRNLYKALEPLNYDKHALWGVSHWGRKRQQFYGFSVNRESALDVYSKRRIIAVTDLKIVEWHNYKHLDWISVRRYDDKIYKFKEGDFKRLHLQDIEDILLFLVQRKL
nr:hypothetical protein [Tanacetum cinerariifolium]